MADHARCEDIGRAWRLYMHLLLTDEGKLSGSYDEISLVVGNSGETMRKWAKRLKEKGLIEIKPKGRNIELVLTDPSMQVAKSPDCQIREIAAEHPEEATQIKKCRILVEACNKSGSAIWMQIEPETK